MRRILASLFVIALGLGLALGSTFAAFTSSDSETGSVAAGNVEIRLNTLNDSTFIGSHEIVWDVPPCVSNLMTPGMVCHYNLTVHNDGSLWVTYTVGVIETTCFDVSFDAPADTADTPGDGVGAAHAGKLPPNDVEPETVFAHVTLVDDDACQGVTAEVGITATASSITAP